jgi:transposase
VRSEKRVIQQAFRFELDPNRAQRVLLAKSVGASRYVYNWGLAESKRQYELTGKRPRFGDLKKQLVELKQTEAPWLYEVSAHIGQSALKDLNVAFERFFKSVKGEGPKAGYPRFKKKGERDSARIYEVTLEERHLRIPNVGRVRLKETCGERGFDGRVLRRQLADKSGWYGATLVIADRFFPASKLCSGCGTIKSTLNLSERVYCCDVCGLSLDRDENAAINLRRLAEQLPVDRREVTPVERKALAATPVAVKPSSLKQEATADSTRCSTRRSTRKQVLVRV